MYGRQHRPREGGEDRDLESEKERGWALREEERRGGKKSGGVG